MAIPTIAASTAVTTVPTTMPATVPTAAVNTVPTTVPTTAPTGLSTAPTEPEPPVTKPPLTEPPKPSEDSFVRLRDYIPDIRVELRYATEDNFTGQVIYDFADAWLRYGTMKKLAAVQEALRPLGYGLLIWDAFRPVGAQFTLWEVYPDPTFVANPNYGFSAHSRGNTVDVTLVTLEGGAVDMPTEFDDFSPMADRNYADCSPEAAENARLLERIMKDAGFTPYFGEWWHFSDADSYPVEKEFVPDV